MLNRSYWILPDGEILDLEGNKHIAKVISKPELFRITRQEIEDAYSRHSEKIGLEGKAREEIIKRLVENDYIRIRQYPSHWSVTVYKLNGWTRDRLKKWAEYILNTKSDKYKDVNILVLKTHKRFTYDLETVKKGIHLPCSSIYSRLGFVLSAGLCTYEEYYQTELWNPPVDPYVLPGEWDWKERRCVKK